MERDIRIDKRRLEAVMALREVSNEELAKRMGKHYNSVLRLKAEQSTTLQNLTLLCDALECHPFDLLVAEGFPQPFLAAPVSH